MADKWESSIMFEGKGSAVENFRPITCLPMICKLCRMKLSITSCHVYQKMKIKNDTMKSRKNQSMNSKNNQKMNQTEKKQMKKN